MKPVGYRIQCRYTGRGPFHIEPEDLDDQDDDFIHAWWSLNTAHRPCRSCWDRIYDNDDNNPWRFCFTSLYDLHTVGGDFLRWIEDNPGIFEVVSVWVMEETDDNFLRSPSGVQGVFNSDLCHVQVEDSTNLPTTVADLSIHEPVGTKE